MVIDLSIILTEKCLGCNNIRVHRLTLLHPRQKSIEYTHYLYFL